MLPIRFKLVAGLTRLYPLYSGCATVALHPVVKKLSGIVEEMHWIRGPTGAQIFAPLNDYVGRVIYFVGDLDPKLTWLCKRILRPGDTALDVGTNIGLVTTTMADLVGRQGRVFAFEPNPRLIKLVEQTIERNDMTQVTLRPIALGDADAMLQLQVPTGNTGAATLVRLVESERLVESVDVDVRTLDGEFPNIGSIRLMKIDVEGFEPMVLKGAQRLLLENPPQAIVFELNRFHGKCGEHEANRILLEAGYQIYAIPRTFTCVRLMAVSADTPAAQSGHDFLAIAPGSSLESLGIHALSNQYDSPRH